MKLYELLIYGKNKLRAANDSEYDSNAAFLIEFCFNLDKTQYFLASKDEVSDEKFKEYDSLLNRRMNNEPVQYITGKAFFMGHSFFVNRDVLIPRFDTEILVSTVLEFAKPEMSILDMCTGSGCIILSILSEINANAVGVDISDAALSVAKINAERLKTPVKLIKSDLFENINEKFDIIVSNPPYITPDEMIALEKQVLDFEPKIALEASDNGLFFYKEIINNKKFLKDGGMLFFEVGYTQSLEVSELFKDAGFTDINIVRDLNGVNRVVYARKE